MAEELHPEGAPAYDLPAQPPVFAPRVPQPGEIEEIAQNCVKAPACPKSHARNANS